jgi:ABC-type uncharacterized transport system permease subunit
MPAGSKLSPPMMALYCALIVGLLVLLWRGFDVLWIYALLRAMGTVELSFRVVDWMLRRRDGKLA